MIFNTFSTIFDISCHLTRSVHSGENESVVTDALKSQGSTGSSGLKWKLSPPVVMLRPSDISTCSGNYLKILPSAYENGCFIAVLSRRTEQKDNAKELVKKAALGGLFGDQPATVSSPVIRQPSASLNRVKKSDSQSKGFGSTTGR